LLLNDTVPGDANRSLCRNGQYPLDHRRGSLFRKPRPTCLGEQPRNVRKNASPGFDLSFFRFGAIETTIAAPRHRPQLPPAGKAVVDLGLVVLRSAMRGRPTLCPPKCPGSSRITAWETSMHWHLPLSGGHGPARSNFVEQP